MHTNMQNEDVTYNIEYWLDITKYYIILFSTNNFCTNLYNSSDDWPAQHFQ